MLRCIAWLLFVALVAVACAAPSGDARWSHVRRADVTDSITLTIGIKLQNMDSLEARLLQTSDPKHPLYGQHLSHAQVGEWTAPAASSVEAVSTWLSSAGVDLTKAAWNRYNSWVSAVMTVAQAEKLLNTEYHVYQHKASKKTATRCDSYSLPDTVSPHVDVIGPTSRLPALNSPIESTLPPLTESRRGPKDAVPASCNTDDGTTPQCLKDLYQADVTATSGKSTVAVNGFLEQYTAPDDLQSFFSQFDPKLSGTVPTIVGPNDPSNPGIEASLDIQYSMAMSHGVAATFWYTPGEQPKNPGNEPFLVWLQTLDNTTNAPWVISTSYGDNENTFYFDYAVRVNAEFVKSGARGISLLFSSGDGGVSGGQSGPCTDFIPTFPAASPYVTSVGGTTLSSSGETAVSFSSGGFSNYFPAATWQKAAISDYLTKYGTKIPPSALWNQTGRGFPDVAAMGTDFPIVLDGFVEGVDGTSCSSPTFAGIVALLNDIRFAAGKTSLGFMNQFIYQNPSGFNDITTGNNPGCGTDGFYAAERFDPITGWGTPNYAALAKLVMALP